MRVRLDRVRLHVVPTDRVWLRDSAPTGVLDAAGSVVLLNWAFNALGEVRQLRSTTQRVGRAIARHHRAAASRSRARRRRRPRRARRRRHRRQRPRPAARHRGVAAVRRAGAQPRPRRERTTRRVFARVARRRPRRSGSAKAASATTRTATSTTSRASSATDTVVLAVEEDPADENHARSMDNLRRLRAGRSGAVAAAHRDAAVPAAGDRWTASGCRRATPTSTSPTASCSCRRSTIRTIAWRSTSWRTMPSRTIVGIHAVDLVWGLGTLHCLTQQEPAGC